MVQLVRVETRAFVDVAVRARELGCPIPVGIALLPGNFATAASAAELRYHKAAPEVRSAWRSIGLKDEGPGSEAGIRDLGLGTSSGIRTPIPRSPAGNRGSGARDPELTRGKRDVVAVSPRR